MKTMPSSSVAAIPIEKYEGYRCISDDNAVWLSGGFHVDTLIPSRSLYTLNGRNRQTWEKVVDFRHGRYFHAVAVINGIIVVAGGYSYDKVLASVELYDTKSNSLKRNYNTRFFILNRRENPPHPIGLKIIPLAGKKR